MATKITRRQFMKLTAVVLAAALHPDVVLMDVEMPRSDVIATADALCLICQQAPVIVLSMHDDALTRARAHEAGAAAFVDKSMPVDTLLATIRQIAHSPLGGRFL